MTPVPASGPDMDAVHNTVRCASAAINADISWLYRAAKTEGIRAGLDSAARLTDIVASAARADAALDSGGRDVILATCEQIRIQVSLTALQITDPPGPPR